MAKFPHLIWKLIAASVLVLSASPSHAQLRQPDVGDQPGLLADHSVELDPEFRTTAVLYRTNEATGTIIIQTSERHLHLIQGNGRALRYGIGAGPAQLSSAQLSSASPNEMTSISETRSGRDADRNSS
jgi:lipoprotein-anchoring transpeptidase ErfK/SrfK